MRNSVKYFFIFIVMSLCIGHLFGAPRGFTAMSQSKKSSGKVSSQRATSAQAIYKQSCAKCHGSNGRGETVAGEIAGAPNFADASWQERVTDNRMTVSVTHGRGSMPAFKGKLSQKEISALVAYVRGFKDR